MPTYVYACAACGETYELEQRIVENAITTCTLCGVEGKVKRVIQPVGIAFKGSGFYVNDSVNAPNVIKKEEPKKEEAKTETPAETPAPAPATTATPAPATTTTSSTTPNT